MCVHICMPASNTWHKLSGRKINYAIIYSFFFLILNSHPHPISWMYSKSLNFSS